MRRACRSCSGDDEVRLFLDALAQLFLLRLPGVGVEAELLELFCDQQLRLLRGLNEFYSNVLACQLADPREVCDRLGCFGQLARLCRHRLSGGLRVYLLNQALQCRLDLYDVIVYEKDLSGRVGGLLLEVGGRLREELGLLGQHLQQLELFSGLGHAYLVDGLLDLQFVAQLLGEHLPIAELELGENLLYLLAREDALLYVLAAPELGDSEVSLQLFSGLLVEAELSLQLGLLYSVRTCLVELHGLDNLSAALRELQRRQRLVGRAGGGTERRDEHGATVVHQRLGQQLRQERGPDGNELSPGRDRVDRLPQIRQRLVDGDGLLQPWASGLRLVEALASGEVEDLQRRPGLHLLSERLEVELQHRVCAGRVRVRQRRGDGPVLEGLLEDVDRLLQRRQLGGREAFDLEVVLLNLAHRQVRLARVQ